MTASPIGAWCPSVTSATFPSCSGAPARNATGTFFRSSAVLIGGSVRHGEALVRSFYKPPGGGHGGVAGDTDDLVQGQSVVPETIRINQHLQLAVSLAPDGHVGDAGEWT